MPVVLSQPCVYAMKTDTILKVEDLSHAFGSRLVLDAINLSLSKGTRLAISGLSGSGKTTLLQLISGLTPLQQGSVMMFDYLLSSLSEVELTNLRRDKIGFAYQNPFLLPDLSVAENLLLPLRLQKRSLSYMENQLDKTIVAMKLQNILNNDISSLSGGEKARLCLSRAIIHKPSILFADEPTGNLDNENTATVMEYLFKVNSSMTVVMITHNIPLAKQFDIHLRLENGVLIKYDKG